MHVAGLQRLEQLTDASQRRLHVILKGLEMTRERVQQQCHVRSPLVYSPLPVLRIIGTHVAKPPRTVGIAGHPLDELD